MDVAGLTRVPTKDELIRACAHIRPTLRENAQWSEDNRRLHEDTITALTDAGVLRLTTPARFGGYEANYQTLIEVLMELAAGDGAPAFVSSIWVGSGPIVAQFPQETVDEIYSTADVRISALLTPSAVATPVDGGVIVNGGWAFNTGSLHAHWDVMTAIRRDADGHSVPIVMAIPIKDLGLVDDWFTAGLRGSGSVTRTAEEVFVPQHRTIELPPILSGDHVASESGVLYRAPLISGVVAVAVAVPVGLAKAALTAFMERLPGRAITYTEYKEQSKAPLTHLQVAEARLKIDDAEFHAKRVAELLDRKSATNEEWTLEERSRVRVDVGWANRLAYEAVEILSGASGASSIYSKVPIQRIARDSKTLSLHAFLTPNTNLELYGRILCGEEPNTQFL